MERCVSGEHIRLNDADGINFNDVFVGASEFAQDTRNAAQMLINRQPTAYDVNKVVKQLKERSKEFNSGLRLHGKPEDILTDEAVEIVKCGFESLSRKSEKDLISREQLINKLNSTGTNITFDLPVEEILGENVDLDDFSALMQDAIQAYRKMVIDTIKNIPIAFNLDKKVERLERELMLADQDKERCARENQMQFDFAKGYSMGVTNALEIVKEGD